MHEFFSSPKDPVYELLPASSRDVYREKVSMCQPHDRNHLLHQETQCDSEKVAGCPMHFFLVGLPPPGAGGKWKERHAEGVGCAHRWADGSVEGSALQFVFRGLPPPSQSLGEAISSLSS